MKDYNPADSLREEVARFKATNTFTAMDVTGFYIQAAVVLDEHRRMAEALKLVLLFHSGSPWTQEKQSQWWSGLNATMGEDRENDNAATTANLCDAVRAALKT